jgi:DNA-3-methyladenine glycosylase II
MTNETVVRNHFKRVDSKIHRVMRDLDFGTWLKQWQAKRNDQDYFGALCREIIGQQLSGKAAETITGRFLDVLPGRVLEPTAVLALKDEAMRKAGMSWAKARYVKNIAIEFMAGRIDVQRLHTWSDEQVIDHLVAIKGVGPWTAEMFLMFTLGREDVFSHGDVGLRNGIEKVYGLTNLSREEVEAIINPWSPYKTYGSIALWHALE